MKTLTLHTQTPHHSLFWHMIERTFLNRFQASHGARSPRQKPVEDPINFQEAFENLEELEIYMKEEIR